MANNMMVLRIGALPPGPNSAGDGANRRKGLLAMHHTEYSEMKRSWATLVQSAVQNASTSENFGGFGIGPVWMMVVRYSTSLMDRDNAWASMKPVMDGLVRAGVMADDNETVLPWPRIVQVKVTNKSHCGIVIAMRKMKDTEINDVVAMRTWARTIGHPETGMVDGAVQQLDR